ncbi:Ca2+-binding RTX toxin-like protein [Nocardioides sp. BE266]|uniref:calcium-binding protein n=1 Tax=Nocardioides sp. BE266 TaxID=2817725 RepID=UPI0028606DDC|nr:calcium-binding protein [Nocardioides sp. BE266]MDR7254725.1 Ca2+-binding RTX toxin-like protein [Nocardioides sp. BE266]
MRRTTFIAAGLLGLGLLTPTSAASAAGETCRGEAATIVGSGPDVTGTEGRDVIVTGDSLRVSALGGDDLICVVPGRTGSNVLYVDAGAGADVVDTTSPQLTYYYVDTDLGPGADTLEGGPAGDWVDTGDVAGSQAEVDVVRGAAGNDDVTTPGGSDVVDLGPGTNRLVLHGPGITPEGRLTGGDSYDTLVMTVDARAVFDMAAGTYVGTAGSARFTSFESLDLDARGAEVTYTGTATDDHLTVETYGPDPSTVVAETLGGDDHVTLDRTLLGPGSRIDVGAGRDELVAARAHGSLSLDLRRDRSTVAGDTFTVAGLEDAFLMARTVTMEGDGQDNSLVAYACRSSITGRGGDDELIWDGDYIFEEYHFTCTPRTVMRGGQGKDSFYASRGEDRLFGGDGRDTLRGEGGDDRIRGGAGADEVRAGRGADDVRGGTGADKLFGEEGRDVLVGERGRDLADGSAGRDRCRAERERTCER